jgi:LysM repeat protein
MIEIICKDDPQKAPLGSREDTVFLPKNIRQVGSPRGRHRIYLEDYVYTYLRSAAKNSETCAAVFLGKSQVVKDIRYTFVSGVVECSAAVFQWENICLDESFWDYIYKEQKQFFSELEIVGWALGRAGQVMELTPAVEAAHRKYFAGRDKILMLIDILEGEELFFIYEQGYLQKREGYYIYYEKNLAMQEYMIYKREEEMRLAKLRYSEIAAEDAGEETERLSGEETGQTDPLFAETDEHTSQVSGEENGQTELFAEDDGEQDEGASIHTEQWQDARPIPKEPKTQAEEALESYRKMLLERQGKREERQNRKFLYTASSFFLVVLCVIGITTINNYRKMQKVEDVLNVMNHGKNQSSGAGGSEVAADKNNASDKDSLVVETIESQIEPLNPNNGEQDSSAKLNDDTKQKDSEKPTDGENQDASGKASDGSGQGEDVKSIEDAKQEEDANASNDAKQGEDANASNDAKQEEDANASNDAKQEDNANPSNDAKQADAQETSAGQQRYYTVQAGDTLNSICLNIYKTKDMVKVLKEVNGIEDGDKILVGQKLLLP